MLYIVGMGLEKGDMTEKGMDALKKASKIFVETYTSFPYSLEDAKLTAKIEKVGRKFVEEGNILELAKTSEIVLLVPGDPLFATTHISLVAGARRKRIPVDTIHAPSIINVISRTGVSPYKLGRTITISKPLDSDLEKLQKNQEQELHTLCLLDPAINLHEGIRVLQKFGVKGKIVACERLGMQGERIVYGVPSNLLKLKFLNKPQCIIVPAKLHFFEEEFIETFEL